METEKTIEEEDKENQEPKEPLSSKTEKQDSAAMDDGEILREIKEENKPTEPLRRIYITKYGLVVSYCHA